MPLQKSKLTHKDYHNFIDNNDINGVVFGKMMGLQKDLYLILNGSKKLDKDKQEKFIGILELQETNPGKFNRVLTSAKNRPGPGVSNKPQKKKATTTRRTSRTANKASSTRSSQPSATTGHDVELKFNDVRVAGSLTGDDITGILRKLIGI
jgi:hypothetical protein